MRHTLSIALLLTSAFLAGWSITSRAQNDQGALQQEIINLVRTKDKAFQTGDKQLLDRLYADDYIAISSSGTDTSKKTLLGFFVRPNIFELHRSDNLSVRIFGGTAVVTGVQRRKFHKDIKPGGEGSLRFTDIYVRREGEWKIVAAQFTDMQ
jgi:hypothetical protein